MIPLFEVLSALQPRYPTDPASRGGRASPEASEIRFPDCQQFANRLHGALVFCNQRYRGDTVIDPAELLLELSQQRNLRIQVRAVDRTKQLQRVAESLGFDP